jgi:hypothetical protein
MAGLDLNSVYEEMLSEKHRKRDITSSTPEVFSKSHPRSGLALDFYFEMFGLDPARVKGMPLKSIEALHDGLMFLFKKAKEDPLLRQRFRTFINTEFKKADEEIATGGSEDAAFRESLNYEEYIGNLYEAVAPARRFNYKRLEALGPNSYNDRAIFIPTLTSIDPALVELPLQQRKGILAFLKSLAVLAETSTTTRYILNRLIVLSDKEQDDNIVKEDVDQPAAAQPVLAKPADVPATQPAQSNQEAPAQEPAKEEKPSGKASELFKKLGLDFNSKTDQQKFAAAIVELCSNLPDAKLEPIKKLIKGETPAPAATTSAQPTLEQLKSMLA